MEDWQVGLTGKESATKKVRRQQQSTMTTVSETATATATVTAA